VSGDQWCPDTIELEGRDPAHPAVIDCQRKLTDRRGQRHGHSNHVRRLELEDDVVVEVRWFRRGEG
jgi:hypothetical protein